MDRGAAGASTGPSRPRSWRAAEEVEAWGGPTFRVRSKMFASMDKESATVIVKATKEEQTALIEEDAQTFGVAPYVGRHGWVKVQLSRVDRAHLRELFLEGWRATAPKALVARGTRATRWPSTDASPPPRASRHR